MAYTVSVRLHRGAINTFLYAPGGPITRNVRKLGYDVRRVAQRRAPKDTGKLASSITVTTGSAPGMVYAEIGSNLPYALWRHEGTGIYGSGRPIRPVRARALRFKPGRRGGSAANRRAYADRGFVYRYSVKGTPGEPFLVHALTDVMGRYARIRGFRTGRRRR